MDTSIWTRLVIVAWLAVAPAVLVLTSAFASRAEALVYWANDDSIGRANLNGTGANQRLRPACAAGSVVELSPTGSILDFGFDAGTA